MSGSEKYPYFVNEKVSVEFYNHLLTHAIFKTEPKAVMAAFKWLNNVLRGQQRNDQKPVSFYFEDIKEQFGSYSKTPYTNFVAALVSLDLVTVSGFAQPGFKTKYLSQPGTCRTYRLTEQGKTFVTSSNRQYFKKLNGNKEVMRKAQKRASDNKSNHVPYGDVFLDHQRELLMNLSFDFPKVDHVLDQDPDCNDDCNVFIEICNKHHGRLKRNEKDGRVWNPVVAMASKYRPHLRFKKDLKYVATIDQRASHATFLGLYLLSHHANSIKASSTIHYAGGISDIQRESEGWTEFTTKQEDFRLTIARDCGWPDDKVKERVNKWLNGWKYKKLDEWFAKNYPALSGVWSGMDTDTKKKTGCNICINYETKIFQDPDLYLLADSLGVKLSYEYDGIGIFASSPNIETVLKQLEDHIKATALRVTEVNIVTKTDRFYSNQNQPSVPGAS